MSSTSVDISVVICTHNPRREYLRRTIEGLAKQTLEKDRWELLLVDNCSEMLLCNCWDLTWHPHSRHVREEELGLTSARLRGMNESQGKLLVFVDDDNVLEEDYLSNAWEIYTKNPRLAAFGGQIFPEFESEVPDWFHPFANALAIRSAPRDRWSNNPEDFSSTPLGAGMVVTNELAKYYVATLLANPDRKQLDRKGTSLVSGGDIDMALCACDLGLGKGVFQDLRLVHLIPAARLKLSYLIRLRKSMGYSQTIRKHLRGDGNALMASESFSVRLLLRRIRRYLDQVGLPREAQLLNAALEDGKKEAVAEILRMHKHSAE